MRIKEQKIFFTRNGEYTVWEMLNSLEDTTLYDLCIYTNTEMWTESMPSSKEEYPSFLYRIFEEINEENQEKMITEIKNRFQLVNEPKSDFNAIIYHHKGTSLDFASALLNLNNLKDNIDEFEIVGLQMEIFPYDEFNSISNIIDIRFTNTKSIFFKGNENIQTLNTEIRVYLDLKIAIMTNFSQYTHSDSEKNLFIKEVVEAVSTYRGIVEPVILSDQALRSLLLVNKKMPTSFKVDVDGVVDVGFKIKDSIDTTDVLQQSDVKSFYEKFTLSVVRVKISDDDKHLIIDGNEGKIISKAQNIEVIDIDNFILKLSSLLKFDYINYNYSKDLINLAKRKIIGPNHAKVNIINTCIKEIEKAIVYNCLGANRVYVKSIKNAILHSIVNKTCLEEKITEKIELDTKTLSYLSNTSGLNGHQILINISSIIQIYNENKGEFSDFISHLDNLITSKGMINDASGF